jgi:hypothetical protein
MFDVMTDRLQNVKFSIFKISNFGTFKAKFYVSDEVFDAEKSSEKNLKHESSRIHSVKVT